MFFVQLFFLGYEQLLKEKEKLLMKVAELTEALKRSEATIEAHFLLKQARGRSVPVAEGCVELVFGCVGFLFWIFS